MDKNQNHHRLTDRFTPSFYVRGDSASFHRLEEALGRFRASVGCRFTERIDIWQNRTTQVLQVSVAKPTQFITWVRWVQRFDQRLELFNSDLMLATLYCWERGIFPLALVAVDTNETGFIQAIECKDNEWNLDYVLPPITIMQIRLAGLSRVDPEHGRRAALEVQVEGREYEIDGAYEPPARTFCSLLQRHDPDLILSEWGDATILPHLQQQAERLKLLLPLNRDREATVHKSRSRSYTSYGRILFKNSATTLFGRLHVDTQNSFIADKCELAGLWELTRVTKLPVQYCARTTPGTGISYMQMEIAYGDGVLIPAQKAEPEDWKSPDELLAADRGGLVFVPKLGFSSNVGELDFVSEYPSIMAKRNISPETVNCPCCPGQQLVPELGYHICQKRKGITSRAVAKLIQKRRELKRLHKDAPLDLAQRYTAQREALKWLLVCCFGYTGYKNARFGKIEAHEAINAVARETLLVAKEIAESQGFELIHALVDSLYVHKPEAEREDYELLAGEIERRTGLPIELEAIYRYAVFLPSKQFSDVPVPNRFFAVNEEGGLKVRGLECRRHDTAPLVKRMQREVLEILAGAHDFESYCKKLAEAQAVFARYQERIENGHAFLEDLVISKRLTRAPRDYQKACLTAIAAQQLYGCGTKLRPGQTVEYIITDHKGRLPNDRVRAWALWEGWFGYDRKKYGEMLREAFEPFEVMRLDTAFQTKLQKRELAREAQQTGFF
ncbi:MAG: hypothetical protein HY046_03565 [Acidobacteria bacterium]|nr:hypothetical protein [Acidobacteriota bacterium]